MPPQLVENDRSGGAFEPEVQTRVPAHRVTRPPNRGPSSPSIEGERARCGGDLLDLDERRSDRVALVPPDEGGVVPAAYELAASSPFVVVARRALQSADCLLVQGRVLRPAYLGPAVQPLLPKPPKAYRPKQPAKIDGQRPSGAAPWPGPCVSVAIQNVRDGGEYPDVTLAWLRLNKYCCAGSYITIPSSRRTLLVGLACGLGLVVGVAISPGRPAVQTPWMTLDWRVGHELGHHLQPGRGRHRVYAAMRMNRATEPWARKIEPGTRECLAYLVTVVTVN